MNLGYGYQNLIPLCQHQKPYLLSDDPHRLEPKSLNSSHNSEYEQWRCLKGFSPLDGGGEIDDRLAWRCDCGAEPDVTEDYCRRCGCTKPLEYRK